MEVNKYQTKITIRFTIYIWQFRIWNQKQYRVNIYFIFRIGLKKNNAFYITYLYYFILYIIWYYSYLLLLFFFYSWYSRNDFIIFSFFFCFSIILVLYLFKRNISIIKLYNIRFKCYFRVSIITKISLFFNNIRMQKISISNFLMKFLNFTNIKVDIFQF